MSDDRETKIWQIVDEIKDAYVELMQLWNPKARRMSNKRDSSLFLLAGRLLDAGESPYAYIRFMHRMYGNRSGQLWPNQFLSGTAWRAFDNKAGSEKMERRIFLSSGAQVIAIELKMGRSLEETLLDDTLRVPVVLRYWLGRSENLPAV